MSTWPSTATSKASQKLSNQLKTEHSHRSLRRVNNTERQDDFKENSISDSKSQNGRLKGTGRKGRRKHIFCSCRGKDDGTPMICCGQCREWYHFKCIGLSERDAEDIDVFVCSPCQNETGLQIVKDWEGPEALEEVDESILAANARDILSRRHTREVEASVPEPSTLWQESEQDSDPSSDEYVVGGQLASRRAGKRRVRRMSTPSDDDSDAPSNDDGQKKAKRARLSRTSRRVHTSSSPGPNVNLKRKQSNASQNQPAKKRKSGIDDDPTRKYCLGKLQEIFSQIFLKYPYFREDNDGDQELDLDSHFNKAAEDLTEEERAQLEIKAKEYATEVEHAVFDTYSELDKSGQSVASGKYKERFRMLDFNLKKPDRVVLHKRIVSFSIPPEALSLMSSTDLASEQEKQSIKLAEEESLAHSILQKTAVPRAKITHKGLQDIEDIDGTLASQRDTELDREREEEERRDRERMERSRAAQRQQAGSGSGSVPPESPIVSEHPTWGAPPPVPHVLQPQDPSLSPVERTTLNPLFAQSANTAMNHPVENELNLADLINIDDETSQDGTSAAESALVVNHLSVEPPSEKEPIIQAAQVSPVSSFSPNSPPPTGISPFAVNTFKPDLTTRPSFDLSSVWSAPPKQTESPQNQEPLTAPASTEPKDSLMDSSFFGGETDDNDFDMFLEQDNESGPSSEVVRKEPAFHEYPPVWNGTLHMPLDSTIPQDVPVVARQAGGRVLESSSSLWQTLFPSNSLRIDGRVPVDKSSQYLLQMRMNASKELIAVAFAPPGESESLAFKFLLDHLLGKDRHGLVFPWTQRPKDYHPGRELYIIPLLSSDPLPEYMELFDSLRLPKQRTENYLIGVWILNKGKLAPPPSSVPNPLPQVQSPSTHFTPPAAPLPSIPHISPGPSLSYPSPLGPTPPVNLAAEVASLTPDQIQRMIQQLSAQGNPQILQQQGPPPPPPQPQPWSNGTPFSPTFPLHNRGHAPSQSPPHRPPPYPPYPPYSQADDIGSRRGGRGVPGGRGRGLAGRGNSRGGDRTRDSGWPKRGGRGSW